MPIYKVSNLNAGSEQSLTSSFKTLLGINAATGATTLRRGWLTEFTIGQDAAPSTTDGPVVYSIDTMTAAGTGSALTPSTDDSDAAALLVYTANYTAEPTVTANSNQWAMPLNQRQSWRVQFRDNISSIIVPAVNLKGPVVRAKSPTASAYSGTAVFSGFVTE
jgi:hypothetical protein